MGWETLYTRLHESPSLHHSIALTFFNVPLGKWRAESLQEPALLLDDGRRQVQKVGDLHQLCVGPFGGVDLRFKYRVGLVVWQWVGLT